LFAIPAVQGTATVKISGQVRSEDNQPVVDTWIGVFDGQWNFTGDSTRTNRQGRYEISVPTLDSYIIDIYPPSQLRNGIYGFNYYGLAKKVWRQNSSSIVVDFLLQPVGNIVLKAFGENGSLMREREFGWNRWLYVTDQDGIRVDDRLTMLHDVYSQSKNWDSDLRLPAVTVPVNTARTINLLWDVPGFGRVMVMADNGGKGFTLAHMGDVLVINLNYELARTQLGIVNRALESYTSTGYNVSEDVLTRIGTARRYFADASAAQGDSERALLSNACLNQSLYAGEELEYEKSLEDIELYRKKDVTLRIIDQDGNPLSEAKVSYNQTSHDFLFGNWEIGKGQARNAEAHQLIKQTGINYYVLAFFWGDTEPAPGQYVLSHWLPDKTITVQGHNIVWFHEKWGIGRAEYLHSLTFPQLKDAVYSHVHKIIKECEGQVDYWTVTNEAEATWTNPWDLSLD
jgi:hypothetical protein